MAGSWDWQAGGGGHSAPGASGGDGVITIGPTMERWVPTGELRLLRLALESDRLQAKWLESCSGRFEWRDVPIITKRSEL